MEILVVVGIVAGLLVGAGAGYLVHQKLAGARTAADTLEAERLLADARRDAEAVRREADIEARQRMLEMRQEAEAALEERRTELAKIEERTIGREEGAELKNQELTRREQGIADREAHARTRAGRAQGHQGAAGARPRARRRHDDAAGARPAAAARPRSRCATTWRSSIRRIEAEAKQESDRRVRNIISIGIQRTAASHASATTVSMVDLPSDDLKGRIIGREGRNIRALENLTGVDVIIDDTPAGVILSAFDGVRREIAKLTLEKLLADGRIHPARIEEMYYQAKAEMEERIVEAGERPSFEANVPGLHPELLKTLGRLNYRTSYGQNVLKHSLECAHLAAIMAAELGASERTARRAALLHDIGKAVSHEVEGSHAIISAQLAASTRSRPRSRTPSRRTTSTSSPRPSRRCWCRPPTRSRPPAPAPAARPGELHQAPRVARGDRDVQAGRGEVLRDAGRAATCA